jgi:hypothetical protein
MAEFQENNFLTWADKEYLLEKDRTHKDMTKSLTVLAT